jgi:hypothetical protein
VNFACANGLESRQKALTVRLGSLVVMGDYPIRQLILHTRILVGWFFRELNFGVALAEGLCDLGGITSAEGLRDGDAGRAHFLIMPWHSPYN